MERAQKTIMIWLGLGVGALIIYEFVKNQVGKAAQAVNPINPNNIFNSATNDVYQAITGSQGSIGTDIYNLINTTPASGTAMYFVYNQSGNLVIDPSTGAPQETSYPPGTPQNPYPNPHSTG
ncbi:MAG: hypothetical protein ACREAN_05520 [Nitrosopumilaceae archaeon]